MDKKEEIRQLLRSIWTPHAGQRIVGDAIFNSKAELIYTQCGRKYGKTELSVYCAWVWALLNPNSEIYYLAPLVKQAKELVWANNRMQTCNSLNPNFIPEVERILGGPVKINAQEARVILPNGSFIKVDGSDNYEAQRGLKPDFIVADEYRNFQRQWLETVRPNMLVKRGKILFITTPPHIPNHAYEMAEECRLAYENKDPKYFYIQASSYTNDRIQGNKEWLDDEKARLLRLGRENEWIREYMATFVSNNENAVLPTINRETARPHDTILSEMDSLGAKEDAEIIVTLDPSNTTTFSALISIHFPKEAMVYVVESVEENSSQRANVKAFIADVKSRIDSYRKRYFAPNVYYMHNEKCEWIANDLYSLGSLVSDPSPVEYNDSLYGIMTLKEATMQGRIKISDNCKALIKASELYVKDEETGQIPNKAPPMINCLRYMLPASGFVWEIEPEISLSSPAELFVDNLRNPKGSILDYIKIDDQYSLNDED